MRSNPISSWDRSISNILLGCTTAYLSIHTMKNIWLVSSFGPSQIQLPWIFMYRFLCEHVFHFSSINAHKGVWLLSCKVSEYFYVELLNCLPEWLYHFPTSSVWVIQFLYITARTWYHQYFSFQPFIKMWTGISLWL